MMQVETTTQNITPPRITTAERRGITLPPMTALNLTSPRQRSTLSRSASLNSSPPRRSTSFYSPARVGSSNSLRLRKMPKPLSGTSVGLYSGLGGDPNTNSMNAAKNVTKTTTNNGTPSPPKRTRSSVSAAKLGFGNLIGSLKNINFGAWSGKARRIAELRGRGRAKSDAQVDARLISPLRTKAGTGVGERGFKAQQGASPGRFGGASSLDLRLWDTDEDRDMAPITPVPESVGTPMSSASFGDTNMRSPSPVDCQFAFIHSRMGVNNSSSTIDDPFLTPQHSATSVDCDSRMGAGPSSSPLSTLTNTPERQRKFSTAVAAERSKNKAIQLLGAEASGVVEAKYGKFSND